MATHARVLGVSLALLAAAWLWLAATYIPDIVADGEPGPRAFPLLLGVALATLGIAIAAQPGEEGFGPRSSEAKRVPSEPPADLPHTSIAIATVALLVAYAFVLDKAGFVSATFALMMLAMAGVLRMRRWVFITAFSIVFTLGCRLVFGTLLGIPLPGGSWIP